MISKPSDAALASFILQQPTRAIQKQTDRGHSIDSDSMHIRISIKRDRRRPHYISWAYWPLHPSHRIRRIRLFVAHQHRLDACHRFRHKSDERRGGERGGGRREERRGGAPSQQPDEKQSRAKSLQASGHCTTAQTCWIAEWIPSKLLWLLTFDDRSIS